MAGRVRVVPNPIGVLGGPIGVGKEQRACIHLSDPCGLLGSCGRALGAGKPSLGPSTTRPLADSSACPCLLMSSLLNVGQERWTCSASMQLPKAVRVLTHARMETGGWGGRRSEGLGRRRNGACAGGRPEGAYGHDTGFDGPSKGGKKCNRQGDERSFSLGAEPTHADAPPVVPLVVYMCASTPSHPVHIRPLHRHTKGALARTPPERSRRERVR